MGLCLPQARGARALPRPAALSARGTPRIGLAVSIALAVTIAATAATAATLALDTAILVGRSRPHSSTCERDWWRARGWWRAQGWWKPQGWWRAQG